MNLFRYKYVPVKNVITVVKTKVYRVRWISVAIMLEIRIIDFISMSII